MQTEKTENFISVGEMQKRYVVMADGRRYLIYYTFDSTEIALRNEKSKTETPEKSTPQPGENENV